MSDTTIYTFISVNTINITNLIIACYRHGFLQYATVNNEIFINFAHYQQYVNKVGILVCDSNKVRL